MMQGGCARMIREILMLLSNWIYEFGVATMDFAKRRRMMTRSLGWVMVQLFGWRAVQMVCEDVADSMDGGEDLASMLQLEIS